MTEIKATLKALIALAGGRIYPSKQVEDVNGTSAASLAPWLTGSGVYWTMYG
jgi:hypothetical protein